MTRFVALVALAASLMLASFAGSANARPIADSYQDGGDSACQNGTVLNIDNWKWYAGLDGGGWMRIWTDVYLCESGRYVWIGGFWNS